MDRKETKNSLIHLMFLEEKRESKKWRSTEEFCIASRFSDSSEEISEMSQNELRFVKYTKVCNQMFEI